jgi:hypothetical protein
MCYKERETSPIPHIGNIGAAQNVSKITLRGFVRECLSLPRMRLMLMKNPFWALRAIGRAMDGTCFPKLFGDGNRGDLCICPPGCFVALLVEFLMVLATKRDGELIAHLPPQRSRPRNLQMMRVARARLANEARLRSDEGEVYFTPLAD